jgi:hypothetical protein
VVEDKFFVEVGGDVFEVEFGVEFGRDGGYGLGLGEEEGEGHGLVALFGALFGEGFDAEDLGGRVGFMPGAKEDVVLEKVRLGWVRRGEGRRVTSASRAAMYFTSPISETLDLTSSVRATGEKTARAPDWRRTLRSN